VALPNQENSRTSLNQTLRDLPVGGASSFPEISVDIFKEILRTLWRFFALHYLTKTAFVNVVLI